MGGIFQQNNILPKFPFFHSEWNIPQRAGIISLRWNNILAKCPICGWCAIRSTVAGLKKSKSLILGVNFCQKLPILVSLNSQKRQYENVFRILFRSYPEYLFG